MENNLFKKEESALRTAAVRVGERLLTVACGTTLSEAISGERPCGGHGKCGKCKVAVRGSVSKISDTELKILSPDEIASGIRLACLTTVEGECEIFTRSKGENAEILTAGELPHFEPDPIFSNIGAAIDIGTTTLAARLYGKEARLLAEASMLNPQSEWGADVISRIENAISGKADELADSIRSAINSLIRELARSAGASTELIDGIVITGNTVMLSLLAKESIEPFSCAPFEAKRLFGETVRSDEIGLNSLKKNTTVYIPPCIHAFIGADTTCAIVANRLTKHNDPVMLADIGTNGEMALWNASRLSVCSTAAGPAFEGVGISMGMRGSVGAVDKVYAENGVFKAHVIGEGEPIGICGSALIDATACMLECEILDESGYLEDGTFTVLPPVALNQKDIRMLQLAKSAICAGILSLISHASVQKSEIKALFIAGGFGNYLNLENAARIGLIPKTLVGVSKTVGNSALVGASMLLLRKEFAKECESIAKNAEVLNLSQDKAFSDLYISGMELSEAE